MYQVLGVILGFFFLALLRGIRVLKEYERGVIFRLGRLAGTRGPGLIYVFPFIESMVKVSLRTVTMDFDYRKTGTFRISQLKGEGPLEVVGETEGKYLRFYFKHHNIPCKGEIVVNAPAPMGTFKEPYEDSFDPHVIAPGENPGAKIELKDGAQTTFSFGPKNYGGGSQIISWKTDFTLDGAELWRVAVEGEEIDTTQSPIRNKKLQNKSKELPIAMQYKWNLIGEFALIVSIVYASIIAGTIVFFALRNNRIMVWGAVIFELAMNTLLDIQAVLVADERAENYIWIFASQLAIGMILPIATKSFADELNKRGK